MVKTLAEINKIKRAAKILALVRKKVVAAVKPGVSLLSLNEIAHQETLRHNGKPAFLGYHGFPAAICTSVNDVLIHGIPTKQVLAEGDLLSLDFGVSFEGYHADAAVTVCVGTPTAENTFLIKTAVTAFKKGLAAIKPGVRTGDIGAAVQTFTRKVNTYVPYQFAGHGIGRELHEDPVVPNFGRPKTGIVLEDNMVICIEPMVMQGNNKVVQDNDGWTIRCASGRKSSHYEHTVWIHNGKPVVLTREV